MQVCPLLMRAGSAEGAVAQQRVQCQQTTRVKDISNSITGFPPRSLQWFPSAEGSPHGVRTFVVLVGIQEAQNFEGLSCTRLHCSAGPSACMLSDTSAELSNSLVRFF